MTTDASSVERLRQYIREISPEARALLLRELERGTLAGSRIPGFDLILQELRDEQRGSAHSMERLDSPDRRFFQPLAPFLTDDEISQKIHGRINRSSLTKIWVWLERDLLPVETKAFSEEVAVASIAGDIIRADQLTHEFQTKAVSAIENIFRQNAADRKSQLKLVSQLGGQQALEALSDVIAILRIRDTLAGFSARLPQQIKNLADADLQSVSALFERPVLQRPEIFPYALALLFSRLAFPAHLLRLAVAVCETDSAERIAETPFAFAVDLVLDEMTRLEARLANDLRKRSIYDVCIGIKKFHDLARGLTAELDVSVGTRWTKILAQLRADTANLLRSQIDGLPGQTRKVLRPRPKDEITSGAVLDPHEIADIEASLEILGACRMCAGEIALNEITLRVSSELENCLDTATQALLDSIRQATPQDRAYRQSQLDAAVRFSAKVFGKRYAELLAKAAEVATQGERRTA